MTERSMTWLAAAIATLALMLCYRAAELTIAPAAGLMYLVMLLLAVGVSGLRPRLDTAMQHRLADLIELTGLFCWFSLLGGLASYGIAAGSTGFVDPALARADAALGFDWPAAYRFVAERSWLSAAAGLAYRSIFVSPLIVIFGLVWSGRSARATQFIATFALALTATLVCFHFLPARSALAYYVGGDAPYLPATGIAHVALIEGLRSGAVMTVDPGQIVGMVTFPSFHAVCAVLFVWAAWPVRGLRVPLLLVNGAMLLATPVEGTHYLVDVIAGVLLAGLLIALVRWSAGVTRARRRPARSPAAA